MNSVWHFIPNKTKNNVYFPSIEYVKRAQDCNGVYNTAFFDDAIPGHSTLGYKNLVEFPNKNRGQRFAHSARIPSVYDMNYHNDFVTSNDINNSLTFQDFGHSYTKKYNEKQNNHTSIFREKNNFYKSSYNDTFYLKDVRNNKYDEMLNKTKMNSSEHLQSHLKDKRFSNIENYSTYDLSTGLLGKDRMMKYQSECIPIIPSEILTNRSTNNRRVSGNIILSRIRNNETSLIS